MRAPWLLAAFLLPLPVGAGTPEQPEVTDPPGDVAAFGVPATAAFGWGDLQAAWFEADGDQVRLRLKVGEGQSAPPQGEVGATFRVGDQHWIAGYTVVPGLYAGGFLSKADAQGDVPDSADPATMPGSWEPGLVTVTFPLAEVDPDGEHGRLEEPWAWSESRATNGEQWRLDRSEAGRPFAWRLRAPEPGPAAADAGEGQGAPLPVAAALAGLAAAAIASRRRA
jgi:hypothetical protein